jgi:hypothetical protein
MSVCHVANVDNRAVDLLHREIVEPVHESRAGIQRHVPLELADLLRAGGKYEILRRDGIDHVVCRHMVRLHGLLIEIDLRLEDLSAIWRRQGGALHGGQLRTDEILAEVEELVFGQFLARQG